MGVKREPKLVAPPALPQALLEALEELVHADGMDVLDEWRWNAAERCWMLCCRLTVPVDDGSEVPRRSDWVVLVEGTYPWGYIHIQPAARNGIELTFPHQSLNRPYSPERMWRTGRICVDTGVHALGRHGADREPYTTPDRLRWRLERARSWLLAASRGALFRPGDPFELPDLEAKPSALVAFAEDVSSLATWEGETAKYGSAFLARICERPAVLAVTSFRDPTGREVNAPRWGKFISDPMRPRQTAVWMRLKETPRLHPWRAPMTWGELRRAALTQGLELDAALRAVLEPTRDGAGHILLIGFPLPAVIGGALMSYFWQAIQLAPVPADTGEPRNGFRRGRAPRVDVAKLAQFRDDARITWVRTENWHSNTIAARGRLPQALTTAEVLVIGAGALGSAVAEMLVRGGVERLTVCDDDIVMAGNLVRHTLTLDEVGRFKAAALADRLNAQSPHADVRAITHAFPPVDAASLAALRPIDMVIDCTGENAVAQAMASFPWTGHKLFASISLGLRAWAGFSFISWTDAFPVETFFAALQPWLVRQAVMYRDVEWPREGVGCWHPVFPARSDEVWLLAAAAVQHLVDAVDPVIEGSELVVFRRTEQGGFFAGLTRVTGSADA